MSYDPQTHLTYIPTMEWPMVYMDSAKQRAGLIEGWFTVPAFPPQDYDPKELKSLYGPLPSLKELDRTIPLPSRRQDRLTEVVGVMSRFANTPDTDPSLPAGFAPFGIQDINGQVYVAFAATDGGKGGYIDIFEENGTFVKTLSKGSPLNQPWGIALAPSNFGTLSSTLLISNNNNTGNINGFSPTTGAFIGALVGENGKAIHINQIWGIEFGGGSSSNGNTNQLFYTAGPKNNLDGIFGVINSD